MSSTIARLGRESSGQALSEYGIILAMVAGMRWLGRVGEGVLDDPLLLGGAVVVLVLAMASSLRTRR